MHYLSTDLLYAIFAGYNLKLIIIITVFIAINFQAVFQIKSVENVYDLSPYQISDA